MMYDNDWKLSQDYTGYEERIATQVILSGIVNGEITYRMEHGSPLKVFTYIVPKKLLQVTNDMFADGSIVIGHCHAIRMIRPAGQTRPENIIWVDAATLAQYVSNQPVRKSDAEQHLDSLVTF